VLKEVGGKPRIGLCEARGGSGTLGTEKARETTAEASGFQRSHPYLGLCSACGGGFPVLGRLLLDRLIHVVD
jgi:hypothetical protein